MDGAPGEDGHRIMQTVEAAAHVARFNSDEDFQAAGKTQHGREEYSSRIKAAARSTWPGNEIRSFAPPGSNTSMARPTAMEVEWSISAGTSDNKAGWSARGVSAVPAGLPFLIQETSV